MAAQATTALSMKLFIDPKSKRVLFAEAGKDVVDFLFSLLDLPLGTIVSLAGTGLLTVSASKLYSSAERHSSRPVAVCSPAASLFVASSFDASRIFFTCKNNYRGYDNYSGYGALLCISIERCCFYISDVRDTPCPNCGNPMTRTLQHVPSVGVDSPASCSSSPAAAAAAAAAGTDGSRLMPALSSRIYFRCVHHGQYSACKVPDGCNLYMADVKGTAACPNCDNPMTETLHYVSPAWCGRSNNPTDKEQSGSGGGGSVPDQEAALYTVHDDLTIMPNTPTSATLLHTFGVTDLGALEERTVRIGYKEGLEILNALLHTNTVLTDVFLRQAGAWT